MPEKPQVNEDFKGVGAWLKKLRSRSRSSSSAAASPD
jgi:hypothetical protein